jgi:UDP-GlcNAc:undecaprenyl-phosphate/decaprenyl-phosphate GlcNAc-1-phosphate transferase
VSAADALLRAWPAAVAMAVSAAAVALLLRRSSRLPQDAPNARSLHDRATPRGGGVAIWAGVLAALAVQPGLVRTALPVGLAWAALVLVSFTDDRRGVSPGARLAVHLAAAGAAAAWLLDGTGTVTAAWVAWPLATLAIAWAANLFNFMDGSDGLAATMAVMGFGAYALGNLIAGHPPLVALAVAASVLPFLCVNRPPARLFMGDVGAVPLGFLAAVLGLGGVLHETWPGWFPLLAFLPFIADATVTLLRRALRGARLWEAHREHYYQRHHQLGSGHAGTLRLHAALITGAAASAVLALAIEPGAGWAVLTAWCGLLAVVYARIDYHWRRRVRDSA